MAAITDQYMHENLALSKDYSLVLLKAAAHYGADGSDTIIWEHGRRNFQLRADGLISVVCRVADDTELCGMCVFTTSPERTAQIMADDPAVRAGIFTFEVHPVRGFPGDSLA